MGSYHIDELIERWGKGQLTGEQAIGQLLLQIVELSARIGLLETRVDTWQRSSLSTPPTQPAQQHRRPGRKRKGGKPTTLP